MVYQSETMEIYSESPGLQVCKRDVLTPERNGELITEHPDLLYAVLMPWVHGVTWFDVIAEQKQLKRTESLALAKALAAIGSGMEQRGLAHCDLSAPNVMLPFFSEVDMPGKKSVVELVDVEQMYSPKMDLAGRAFVGLSRLRGASHGTKRAVERLCGPFCRGDHHCRNAGLVRSARGGKSVGRKLLRSA